jgi:hypothetical protein
MDFYDSLLTKISLFTAKYNTRPFDKVLSVNKDL